MPDEQVPTYNLKVVLKQTGLKGDTLRAWERRYGLPNPERSTGKHRLYSQRDIDTIKWLVARQGEGMSISNAVDLWNNLESEGNDPLLMVEYTTPGASSDVLPSAGGRGLDELRTAWVAACSVFDENSSARILSEAFALYGVEDVCLQVILQGMRLVGQEWYRGDVAVEQEHFASAIVTRQLQALLAAAPSPTRSEKILIGAAPGEQHDLALLMIALLLRRRGWNVTYLGANVPLESFQTIFDSAQFATVIISAEQLFTAENLRDAAILAHKVNLPLLYGGRIFHKIPDLRERIPGHYLGEQLEAVPGLVVQALADPSLVTLPEPIDESYQNALLEFEEQSPRIELMARQHISSHVPPESIAIANVNFTRDILAALSFGDLNFVDQELDWIRGLIENRGLPAAFLESYLESYTRAARELLGQNGQIVVTWLQQLKQEYLVR